MDTAFAMALLFLMWAIFRFFGGRTATCLFCGTKTGQHGNNCPWRKR